MPVPIAALIMAGASIAGGVMGQQAGMANKKAVRKAARKNYNTMMNNARMMEKSVYENMATYQRDAAAYRDTMYQRTMANGGIRADETNRAALEEVDSFKFDVDKVDANAQEYGEIKKYNDAQEGQWYNKSYQQYYETKHKAKIDDKNNEALYNSLMNYEGRQAEFGEQNVNSALGVMRESTRELQSDLNRTYVQGMTEVLQQRQAAQNAWQSMETQAQMYQIQGMQSLWNGLLGAGTTMASAFGQMKSAQAETQWRNQQLNAWNRIAAGLEGLQPNQGGR